MAAYSLSSSFTPGTFLEMDVFPPLPWIISRGLRETHTLQPNLELCNNNTINTHIYFLYRSAVCGSDCRNAETAERLRQRHTCIAGVWVGVFTPSHPSRAPKNEASGWAAGMGMQCSCLLGLAIKIEPILQNTAWFTILRFFPQLCILNNQLIKVPGGSKSYILDWPQLIYFCFHLTFKLVS